MAELQKVSDAPMLQTEEEIQRAKSGEAAENNVMEFGEDDIVIVQNILDIPFRFKYEGALYELDPGEQTSLPGFMAWHYLKSFADYYYRHVERTEANLRKARARGYQRNEPLFAKLIIRETEIKKPVDAESRGKVIKLKSDAHIDDSIKEAVGGDIGTGEGDQVLPERKLSNKVASEQEFVDAQTDQDRAIDEFNDAIEGGMSKEEFKAKKEAEAKKAEADAKKSSKAKK